MTRRRCSGPVPHLSEGDTDVSVNMETVGSDFVFFNCVCLLRVGDNPLEELTVMDLQLPHVSIELHGEFHCLSPISNLKSVSLISGAWKR